MDNRKVLELRNAGGDCLGYYVSDDEGVTQDEAAATVFDEATARTEARFTNEQWDLEDGEHFVVVEAPHSI